ncbi:MAG: ABC transporter substrate-binding protein [Bacteroidetes bacterium]|jgi:ABC-type branched-subunit amino acid transport system substrate-binding protein|nr:ABC transporter substrate-binding protein [Bacteroidota bacterium]
MTLRSAVLLACVLMGLALAGPAQAQVTEPPVRSEEARTTFEQGLTAFDEGDYGMAYRRFRLVYEAYPLNRHTTAALLMAGRALYRQAAYEEAIDLLTQFVERYPTSSYTGAARSTIERSREALAQKKRLEQRLRLGIALPMTPREAAFSQSLFNGIRLAVDAFNADTSRTHSVQLVFADTKNAAGATRRAVTRLARNDSVDAIIGPLFSEEARAAAQAAEEQEVVLVAPLATEDDVSAGRRYTFQANPTIGVRGRVMATFAIRDMRLASFGLFAEQGTNSISERMAEGFQEESFRLGADVVFYEWLQARREWASVLDKVGMDSIRSVEALYLPIDGQGAPQLAEGILRSLDRAGTYPRVLGNTRWSGLRDAALASRFHVTYTTEYHLDADDEAVLNFEERYEALAGEAPDRLAYVGYDVAQYLLEHLVEHETTDTPLVDVLQAAPRYDGLATRIDFGQSNVNQAMFILTYRDGERRLLR